MMWITDYARGAAVALALALTLGAAVVMLARAAPAEVPEAKAQASIGGGGCRWELAEVAARHDGPGAGSLRTATMLLDQCSGRTWILVAAPRAGLESRGVGRDFWPE